MEVFASGWTLAAATAVAKCADEYETLGLLTALHDHSLIVAERGERPRYRMLETVRQYAQHKLDESGEADATHTRHAEYYLAEVERAAPHLRGPEQPQWIGAAASGAGEPGGRDNLVRHADVRSMPQWGLRLVAATARYWISMGSKSAPSRSGRTLQPTATQDRPTAFQHTTCAG